MEDFNLNVINLQKHEIIYKHHKQDGVISFIKKHVPAKLTESAKTDVPEPLYVAKKTRIGFAASIAIFAITFGLVFGSMHFVKEYDAALSEAITYIKNPANVGFDINNKIIHTSAGYNEFNEDKEVELLFPVISKKVEVTEGGINFEVIDNVMVTSSASGVVLNVGNLESGGKYITIKHSRDVVTKYENIDIAGVVPGDIVKFGQDIATAKVGSIVRFSVEVSGQIVTDLKTSSNKVIWKK